jgi:hypothetical protein
MDNFVKWFLILLALAGGYFFYEKNITHKARIKSELEAAEKHKKWVEEENAKRLKWYADNCSYVKLKVGNRNPIHALEASQHYGFRTNAKVTNIHVGDFDCSVGDRLYSELTDAQGNMFFELFFKDSKQVSFSFTNVRDGSSFYELCKGTGSNPLIYMDTDTDSEILVQATAGAVFKTVKYQDKMRITGNSPNNEVVGEYLIFDGEEKQIRISENQELHFRAAEVPFFVKKAYPQEVTFGELLQEVTATIVGRLYDHDGLNRSVSANRSDIPAIYLRSGETYNTGIWIDKGDAIGVEFDPIDKSRPFILSLNTVDPEIKAADNLRYFFGKASMEPYWHPHACADGYFTIKALKPLVIREIYVDRQKSWLFEFENTKPQYINVFKDDIVHTISWDIRYFVDGQIVDKGQGFLYKVPKDGRLEIKPGILREGTKEEVKVSIHSRKGT